MTLWALPIPVTQTDSTILVRSSSGLYCALVLLSATPVAGMTSLFAQQFGRETAPAAESITLSTLLSILTLPLFAVLARGISMF